MPTLTNNETMGLTNGSWSVTANMTAGTATLQMSVNSGPFFDIDGATFAQTGGGLILVPKCTVKAILTGDAVIDIEKIIYR